MDSTPEAPVDGDAQFVRLFAQFENDLHRYVQSLVFDRSSVDDIMQEVAVALWKKFPRYDPERPFFPWACRFAYFEVLKHRQRSKENRLFFSEELIEKLADDYDSEHELLVARRDALDRCVAKLGPADQELVGLRYGSRQTIQDLAQKKETSVFKLYHGLARIRRVLMQCVHRTLITEGWDGNA